MGERPKLVSDIGEFELIERIARRIDKPTGNVVLGIGDDVAVVEPERGQLTIVTCDSQVEGVHFDAGSADAERLGRKAVAINFSDIAAAGGRPDYVTVSLVLPRSTSVAFIDSLYDGMMAQARRYHASIVGGNISRGSQLVIDLTVIGRVGTIVERARSAFDTPTPRVDEARAIVAAGGATAALDVSDGLAADLAHLCRASGVGARVVAACLPIDPAATAVGSVTDVDPLELALFGGEDYELLFSAGEADVARIRSAIEEATQTPVREVGQLVSAESGIVLVADDGQRALAPRGWRHF